jgi:CBS domain-containing protein
MKRDAINGISRASTAASIKIKEIMTKNVVTIGTEEPVFNMVKKMVKSDVECVPVTRLGKLRGLITFRDIIRKVIYNQKDPKKVKAKDIMTKSVVTCAPDSTVIDVVKLMKNKKLRRIPVVDKNKRLVGLVTNFDLAILGWDTE